MNPEEMSLKDCIFGRRTIRKYTDDPIPEPVMHEILTAALHAPSACNFQAWKFIVLNDEKKKAEFLEAYGTGPRGGRPMIENCRQGVLVTYRNDLGVSGRGFSDYIQSAAAAIQNMLLMASSYGIGCCWICDLPEPDKIRTVFHIPENYDVIAFVSMGYPQKSGTTAASQAYHYGSEEKFKQHKKRYSFEQFVSYNQFERIPGDSTYARYPRYNRVAKLKSRFPGLYGFYQKLRHRVTPNADQE